MNLIQSNVQTMSSREIAELTGKQHSKVMRTVEDLVNKGIAKMATLSPVKNEQNGQVYNEYLLGKRDSLVLVARLSPEFTAKVVDRWQELEQAQQPAIPQTYAEALQLAATQAKQLEEQAPVIEYHNKVLAAPNGITTTEIASELGVSAIHLNKSLQAMKVQRKVGGRWVLTAANLDQGYTVEVTHVDDGGKSRHSMKWTEKGRKFIHELMTP